MNCFDIFKSLIGENIKIRHVDYISNVPLEIRHYHINNNRYASLIRALDDSNSIQHILNNELFSHVFSKGLYRAELLYELLNGILYFSKRSLTFRSDKHLYHTIVTVIISSQIFGDANHRTSLFYLKTFFNLSDTKASDIVTHVNIFMECPMENEKSDVCKQYEKYISQKIFIY